MKPTIKTLGVLIVLGAYIGIISCKKTNPDLQEGEVNIKLTINPENPWVPITVYEGNFEKNNIVAEDTVYEKEYSVTLPLGHYSVTAVYKVGDKTIIAVDGDEISLEEDSDDEDGTSEEYVSDANVDVRL